MCVFYLLHDLQSQYIKDQGLKWQKNKVKSFISLLYNSWKHSVSSLEADIVYTTDDNYQNGLSHFLEYDHSFNFQGLVVRSNLYNNINIILWWEIKMPTSMNGCKKDCFEFDVSIKTLPTKKRKKSGNYLSEKKKRDDKLIGSNFLTWKI